MNSVHKTPSGLPFLQRARYRQERERQNRLKTYGRQYAQTLPDTLTPESDSGPVHICPLSSVPFSGCCPVHACPGNKPDFETGGCLYIFYGRTKLDKADIMFSYNLNEKKLQDSVALGQERITQAVGFYRTLNDLRSRNTLGHCPQCGVGHQKGVYVCDNTILCEDRKAFADVFLKTSNLAYAEIQGTRQDVYLMARELDRFKRLAETTHTNMSQLLGVGSNQLKALTDVIAVV